MVIKCKLNSYETKDTRERNRLFWWIYYIILIKNENAALKNEQREGNLNNFKNY